jgi:hypothetical protein
MSEVEHKKRSKHSDSSESAEEQEFPVKKSAPTWLPWVGGGALIAVLLVASYFMGLGAGKGTSTASTAGDGFGSMTRGTGDGTGGMPSGMPSGDMRSGGGRTMGASGTVTAISSTSITIKDTTRGGVVTYTIDSSTTVKSGDDTKAVSDITTGATVRVQPSTSDTTIAATITIES